MSTNLIRLPCVLYVAGGIGYNVFGTYVDSKIYLKRYRNGTIKNSLITNEWEAVNYGAGEFVALRFCDSIVWPISLVTMAVPFIVLSFNPPTPKDQHTPKDPPTN